jgi:hypothetical protein
MDRQALAPLPPLHRRDVAMQIRGDFFPGVESVAVGTLGGGRVRHSADCNAAVTAAAAANGRIERQSTACAPARPDAVPCALKRQPSNPTLVGMTLTAISLGAAFAALVNSAPRPPEPTAAPFTHAELRRVVAGPADLVALVDAGQTRSSEVRKLLRTLFTRRGFVYMGWSPTLPTGFRGGLQGRVEVTSDGLTCLWIALRPTRANDGLLPIVAHELQHAVEALDAQPASVEAIQRLFAERAAFRHRGVFETREAIEVQLRVFDQLRATRRGAR